MHSVSHHQTTCVSVQDREVTQEALFARLKQNRETAIKRKDLWEVPERMPPKMPKTDRGSANTLLNVTNY